ncbi:hypothetical protein [Mycolicibacterium sp.]|uniref:hypothetical protein n=1 Tax=Mycolicibacterium sp. TaxID=2320850 RepID=UPI003D0AE620
MPGPEGQDGPECAKPSGQCWGRDRGDDHCPGAAHRQESDAIAAGCDARPNEHEECGLDGIRYAEKEAVVHGNPESQVADHLGKQSTAYT